MRLRAAAGALAVMAAMMSASRGAAQDTAQKPLPDGVRPGRPFVMGQLGLGVLSVPKYLGSDERFLVPVPIIDLRVARRGYLGGGVTGVSFGTGLYLVESSSFAWTVDLTLTPNRPERRSSALAGMGDRGLGGYGGTSLFYRRGPFQAVAAVAVGVKQEMGVTGTLGVSLAQPLGRRWFGRIDGVTNVASCRAMAWDFGVTEAQAAQREVLLASGAPGLRPGDDVPYAPACGFRDVRLGGTAVYMMRHNVSAIVTGTGVRLLGGAADSPLTRTRTTWEGTVGVAWRF